MLDWTTIHDPKANAICEVLAIENLVRVKTKSKRDEDWILENLRFRASTLSKLKLIQVDGARAVGASGWPQNLNHVNFLFKTKFCLRNRGHCRVVCARRGLNREKLMLLLQQGLAYLPEGVIVRGRVVADTQNHSEN
jgi:hypothetical protein